ncbi:beta-1,3-galactosyltransferase 5-like [Amphibalanus amphitrite]|uniref:beta-1,3-galactosyltransferase 5-like n=1 Tax=Amphibalanus amphitrite TaxID=1232801 RepID=UPI001C910DD5|nr:beta-1,3-galactosyltransferase 5-like [Amphibalanus amphitrite]
MMAPIAFRRRLLLTFCCSLLMLLLVAQQVVHQASQMELPAGCWGVPEPRPGAAVLPQYGRYQYLLNSPVCGGGEQVRAVIVVHSDPRRPEVRQAIRDSLPAAELAQLGLRRAFMLAEASTRLSVNETTISRFAMAAESALYHDIVQGDFHDSYHNLTYKHIMALDWATTFCPQARHIIKMDDDIAYNVYEVLHLLEKSPDTGYLGGNAFRKAKPYRGDSKWHVSLEEWPKEYYPPYVSGWLYIASQDMASAMVRRSTELPFFWIDDLFITGMITERMAINITGFNNLFATSADCVRHTVNQNYPRLGQPNGTVFSPSVVVTPTDRDLDALKAFNKLCRYCRSRPCQKRERGKVCANTY